ncbi:MAG TPA: hypothetical protein VGM84_19185 [Steroidobacteraceae bacterium]|jgi:hypothetical protein
MALPATKQDYPEDHPMEGRIARLETHTEHILMDVSELRVDVRRLDAKIDAVNQALTGKIDALNQALTGKIDGVKDSVTSLAMTLERAIRKITMWGLGLFITLGVGLLTVIARSFHWI